MSSQSMCRYAFVGWLCRSTLVWGLCRSTLVWWLCRSTLVWGLGRSTKVGWLCRSNVAGGYADHDIVVRSRLAFPPGELWASSCSTSPERQEWRGDHTSRVAFSVGATAPFRLFQPATSTHPRRCRRLASSTNDHRERHQSSHHVHASLAQSRNQQTRLHHA